METRLEPLLVIGIGNPFRGDDGAGIAVARHLKNRLPETVNIIEASGEATALMDAWQEADRVVVVDAVRANAAPGTVKRIDLVQQDLPPEVVRSSSHQLGFAEAIELARALKRLPSHLVLIGIQGIDFSEGHRLSPSVKAALEKAGAEVIEVIESWDCGSTRGN